MKKTIKATTLKKEKIGDSHLFVVSFLSKKEIDTQTFVDRLSYGLNCVVSVDEYAGVLHSTKKPLKNKK